MSRLPTDLQSPRMGALGATAGVFRARRKARARRRRNGRRRLEGRTAVRCRCTGRRFCAGRRRRHAGACRSAAERRHRDSSAARWTDGRFRRRRASRSPTARTTREAAAFAAAARAAGVPVNVIDRPAFCDFSFGAIVNRSPLVIGISTDGAAPVFGQVIRAKIEALIPKGFARWAEAARNWRPRVQALGLPFRGRRNFWERFTDARGRRTRYAADRGRSRRAACARPIRRRRLGHARRRRPGRSGTADAARGARAAIRRRDSVRRSGVAPTFSISPAARQRKCWSAKPATRRRANRTTSTR